MTSDRFHHVVKELLERNGAMGVNQLAKELGVPLSTMQKYLDKDQNYFKKNHSRRWVLPEVSAASDMSTASSNYANIIDSQIRSMDALIETLMSQFKATITLMEAHKPLNRSVADMSPNIDTRLVKIHNDSVKINDIIRKKKDNIPEEYEEMLFNLDYVALVIGVGESYAIKILSTDVYALLAGNGNELPEDTIETLKEYQKETNQT